MSLHEQVRFTASNYCFINGANVGIGVTNPLSSLQVAGNILPATCNVSDLGSSNLRWRDLYLSGSTIDIEGLRLSKNTSNDLVVTNNSNQLTKIVANEIQLGSVTIRPTTQGGVDLPDSVSRININKSFIHKLTRLDAMMGPPAFMNVPNGGFLALTHHSTMYDSMDVEYQDPSNIQLFGISNIFTYETAPCTMLGRYDENSRLVWKAYGPETAPYVPSANYLNSRAIATTSDGSIYVAYNAILANSQIAPTYYFFSSNNTYQSISPHFVSSIDPVTGSKYLFIVKYNPSGIIQWISYLHTNANTAYLRVTLETFGNVVFLGAITNSELKFFNPGGSTATITVPDNSEGTYIAISEVAPNGSFQWATKISGYYEGLSYASNTFSMITNKITGRTYVSFLSIDGFKITSSLISNFGVVWSSISANNSRFVLYLSRAIEQNPWSISIRNLYVQSNASASPLYLCSDNSSILVHGVSQPSQMGAPVMFYTLDDLMNNTTSFSAPNNMNGYFITKILENGSFAWANFYGSAATNNNAFVQNPYDDGGVFMYAYNDKILVTHSMPFTIDIYNSISSTSSPSLSVVKQAFNNQFQYFATFSQSNGHPISGSSLYTNMGTFKVYGIASNKDDEVYLMWAIPGSNQQINISFNDASSVGTLYYGTYTVNANDVFAWKFNSGLSSIKWDSKIITHSYEGASSTYTLFGYLHMMGPNERNKLYLYASVPRATTVVFYSPSGVLIDKTGISLQSDSYRHAYFYQLEDTLKDDGVLLVKGCLGVGNVTTPVANLHTNGSIIFQNLPNGSGNAAIRIDNNGRLSIQASDSRYKRNTQPLTDSLNKLLQLTPQQFHWQSEQKLSYGLIAQDIQDVLPDTVWYDASKDLYGIDYDMIHMLTLAAVKDLHNKFENEIQELKDKIASMTN